MPSLPFSTRHLLRVEELESRQLLAGYPPTAVEQLFLERLNDARANPAAYGRAIGLDLADVAPSQPLAFNLLLIQAARQHAEDMNQRGYFGHVTPEGAEPGQRLRQVGFAYHSLNESLARQFPGPEEALRGLITDQGVPDLGHRQHLLALDEFSKTHKQVGIGIVLGESGSFRNYYAIDSATGGYERPFLTGVAFSDTNGNSLYDVGEGLGGVTIAVAGAGVVTTSASGGYGVPLDPGTYTVTASGGGLVRPVSHTVTVAATNYRLNIVPPPVPPEFVQQLYQVILGRTAAPAEVEPWLRAAQGPSGVPAVVSAIERSPEARARLVRTWYAHYLGRPTANGEEQEWVKALLAGLTEEQILGGILGSAEYAQRAAVLVSSGDPDRDFVRTLFQHLLNRPADSVEVENFVVNVLPAVGHSGVVAVVLASQEYRTGQVTTYYTELLQRGTPPAPAEVSPWVVSSLDLTRIRVEFETSGEFLRKAGGGDVVIQVGGLTTAAPGLTGST